MAISKDAYYHGVPIEEEFGFAQAIKVGDTIMLSGQVSVDQDRVVGQGDMAAQIRQAYVNIQKGGSLDMDALMVSAPGLSHLPYFCSFCLLRGHITKVKIPA